MIDETLETQRMTSNGLLYNLLSVWKAPWTWLSAVRRLPHFHTVAATARSFWASMTRRHRLRQLQHTLSLTIHRPSTDILHIHIHTTLWRHQFIQEQTYMHKTNGNNSVFLESKKIQNATYNCPYHWLCGQHNKWYKFSSVDFRGYILKTSQEDLWKIFYESFENVAPCVLRKWLRQANCFLRAINDAVLWFGLKSYNRPTCSWIWISK